MSDRVGASLQFLRDLLESAPPDCVIWPFFRDVNGYGRIGRKGRQYWAHRLMCEMAHGEAPSKKHEATHSCGNGKGGCVNPRHLLWGTRARNQLDRKYHGTGATGKYRGPRSKLTLVDVTEIRGLKDYLTQREIADMFGVSDATIRDIYSGKSWKGNFRSMTLDELAAIRLSTKSIREIAEEFGMDYGMVWRVKRGRTYKDILTAAK